MKGFRTVRRGIFPWAIKPFLVCRTEIQKSGRRGILEAVAGHGGVAVVVEALHPPRLPHLRGVEGSLHGPIKQKRI